MFFVLKKDKIMAFLVACSTVFVLFLMSSFFTKAPEDATPTSVTQGKNIENTSFLEENILENKIVDID